MTEPEPPDAPEQPEPATAEAINRQWADELWYPVLPYRGRP